MVTLKTMALVLLLATTPAFAQMTAAQAQAKMAEQKLAQRQAREATAATQPSDLTNAQVYQLQSEVTQLRAENDKLLATVSTLQQQLQNLQQAGQVASSAFIGDGEARVGMTLYDLKRLPNAQIDLISENTAAAVYRIATGRIDDYADRAVDDLPSTTQGPGTRVERVVVGSHPGKVQRVVIDAVTGKAVRVDLFSDQ
jgi:hypothetical protein